MIENLDGIKNRRRKRKRRRRDRKTKVHRNESQKKRTYRRVQHQIGTSIPKIFAMMSLFCKKQINLYRHRS